jgi:hypothetical protein
VRNLISTLLDQSLLNDLDQGLLAFGRKLLNHIKRLLKWSQYSMFHIHRSYHFRHPQFPLYHVGKRLLHAPKVVGTTDQQTYRYQC